MKRLTRLWHRHVLGHFVVFRPALFPDETIGRTRDGRPMVNVYHQTTYRRADAHYECSCGTEWTA